MAFTQTDIRLAIIRVAAKKFANRLRNERWAESIPDEDVNKFTDEELNTYKMTLRQHGCRMREHDFKWESI